MSEFSYEIRGALGAAYFGGWSAINNAHTPIPAALFDMSGAYAWSHETQGLQRFRIAETVRTRSALREVRTLERDPDLVSKLQVGDVPFEGRPILVRLVPTGSEILITKVVRQGRARVVFAPTDINGAANWWWLNDVLAGVAFGGPFPTHIVEAIEFVPVGVRSGIVPVNLPGGCLVDPRVEDVGSVARLQRQVVLHDESIPAWQRSLIQGQLRLLGSALAFGNTSRVDRSNLRRSVTDSSIGPDGELISYSTSHPEQPGPHFDFVVAGSVTSRVRLAMASTISALHAAGGEYLHAATDSLIIGVTHTDEAEFVPCRGGAVRRGRQHGILALPFCQVEEILKSTGAPWRCQHGGEVPMVGYVSGLYKYGLIDLKTGEGVATESALGGIYLDPTGTEARTADGHYRWAVQANIAVVKAGISGGTKGPSPEIDLPPWADHVAVRPGVASTSAQVDRLARAFPDQRIRPFTQYYSAVIDQTRSTHGVVVTLDVHLPPDRLLTARWVDVDTGTEVVPTRSRHPRPGETRFATIRDVVTSWRIVDDPASECVERSNHVLETGMRRVLPVRSRPEMVELVGKEGDDLLSLMTDPLSSTGDELTTVRRADPWPSVLEKARLIGIDELVPRTPLSKRTLERVLAGECVADTTKATISAAVEDALDAGVPLNPKVCARPGCGVPITGRRRWCSEACRKKVERGRDTVDLHKVSATRCPKCDAVLFGKKSQLCTSCGGRRRIEVRTTSCPNCGMTRIGNTDSPCPNCQKEKKT